MAPLSMFLRAVSRPMGVLWDDQTDVAMAAAGVVESIQLKGPERYQQLRDWLAGIWPRTRSYVYETCAPPPVRVFGGYAFHHGGADPPWQEFGDGAFTLPRWYYGRGRNNAGFLGMTVRGDVDTGPLRHSQLMEQLDGIIDALRVAEGHESRGMRVATPRTVDASVHQLPIEEWQAHLARVKHAFQEGHYRKIVAARRCDVDVEGSIDDLDVVRALAAEPECTRFAFRRSMMTFLGASPETLFRKVGTKLTTHALAGTIRSLGSEFPVLSRRSTELLENEKENAEHELVVRDIEGVLRPFCDEIISPRQPQVHKVRNILHLNTKFEARLRTGVDPVDLVAAMHPTPAVGGTPKREAVEWILANEPLYRGWYTGTVGWMDATQDAQFVVAIRCGLVGRSVAHIYTGAGIVPSSNPTEEYAETELKQLPMLRALGIVT
jgi:menaquinone-specific isochorismate synthase